MNIPVNEANETKALIHELIATVSKEAKQLFVSSAEDLAQQYYGSREGKVLQIAVDDTVDIDLEWLQERLNDKASTEIDRLRGFVEGLIEERDGARNEVERLKAEVEWLRASNEAARERADRGETGP